ncbi:hypothetical protein [Phocaeicola plebeius]|jgi:hypothetical protein|uniref:hypothetical protein n=1 Tax=Phocaeicola plebeius TaxID=310297 RepID=UPI00241DE8F5|nr:hypothetical protein [Phocaeicola plebeius]
MNNPIYIAFDDGDKSLGHFFQACADEIKQATIENNFSYESISANILTKEIINSYTSSAEEYVFCAFSHGIDTALLCNNEPYIESNDNVCNFYSSVFFTFACHTAKGIGREFQDAYVLGYLGYKDEIWVIPAYEDIFVKCATSGLLSYLHGNSLKKSYEDMITEYDRQIKAGKVNLIYSTLLRNKQALVAIINNETKTIYD